VLVKAVLPHSLHSGDVENRRAQQDALLQLLKLLAGSQADVLAQGLLNDRSPDPGFFGLNSVTWRVLREPLLILGGSRALLMQVAHPLVAQGVVDYSRYETQPYGRLLETSRWVYAFAFGSSAEALAAVEHLRSVHARVQGKLETANATAVLAASSRYDALDRELGTWVYATLVQSMLATHSALIGGLSGFQRDTFVREWAQAGEIMDVRPSPRWRDTASLDAHVDDQISAGVVQPVPAARRIAQTILQPPVPWPQLRPVSRIIALITAGLLPRDVRAGYGLSWSPLHQRAFQAVCDNLQALHGYLPKFARVSPMWDLAIARSIS
jgi:uncharacterized protein (DUF2236 family)